jgi:tetratricopeptide (TPR) repeat protein
MNGAIKWYCVLSTYLLLLVGCDAINDDPSSSSKRILKNPPYEGITDSIETFPDNATLYLRRALLLSQNNRHEIATADYKKSWELKPEANTALEYVSNLLMVDKVKEAVSLLKQGIQKYPDNPEFSRRLSEVYYQTGKSKEALQQFNKILERDSTDFEIWYDKGLLLTQLKDTPAAIQALEKSFQLQPINYSGLALATLYASRKNPRALEICDQLLATDTAEQQTDPIFMKGIYFSETKQYEKALQQFDECIKRDWKFTDAYIEKGIVLYEQKKYDEALKIFSLASTVSNTDADTYFWMARSYEVLGNKEEAVKNYERALSLERDFKEAWEALQRLKE